MKQLASILFSARLMALVLFVFAASIGFATFIENDFGGATARSFVYNARWFEVMLLVGSINLIGRIFTQKLFTKAKFTIFLFHIAFVIILLGAAVTRYTSHEGTLWVREGKSSNQFITNKTYIGFTAKSGNVKVQQQFPVFFSIAGKNKFFKKVDAGSKTLGLKLKNYLPNAVETIEPDDTGKPVAQFLYGDSSGRHIRVIGKGDFGKIGDISFSFDTNSSDPHSVLLFSSPDSLSFISRFPVTEAGMTGDSFRILKEGVPHRFIPHHLYTFNGQMILLNNFHHTGKITVRSVPESEGLYPDALVMEINTPNETKLVTVFGKEGSIGNYANTNVNNIDLTINYGSITYRLPFEITLKDFRIERYAGSGSPSSFESYVTVNDNNRNKHFPAKIYMNNILRYKGYRFYQTSYDPDEKGTILSVNSDFAGTFISYTGYFLMTLGMILSLFNPNSRFRKVSEETKDVQKKLKSLSVIIIILLGSFTGVALGKAPEKGRIPVINKSHAEDFGRMLIQDNGGRIEPINTLSSEVIRKLYRKTSYKNKNSDEVFLSMLAHPAQWQYEPIVRVTNPAIQKLMNSESRYFSYADFFANNGYILNHEVENAFRKKPSQRSKFDNEIIRLNEKINICYMIFSGELLRLFPVPGDTGRTWHSHQNIRGLINNSDSTFVENVLIYYVQEVSRSSESGDWKSPGKILEAIRKYQLKYAPEIIPPANKTRMEIWLNRANIFSSISKYYGIIGFLLLMIQFAGLFYRRLKVNIPVITANLLIIILFTMHSIGLGLRWYVSGHAPWSNGYEALTYIAWASVLAGLIFARRSPITMSITSILAFLILFVAHLSWMDPQITNLVPVLRSYWLIIHVATITASYGFLAMGALLSFVNLVLMIFQSKKNFEYIKLHIIEFTNTTEMAFTIGLYLLSIGVFLGAVWANESWGRYWGWDPKETWALVSMLVYAFILHMRVIPGLKGLFAFNVASLLGIGSIVMTYFGVNYYLSGLHSYASGDPIPVPAFVYYTLATIFATIILAYFRQKHTNVTGN